MLFEALLTMGLDEDLPSAEPLARVVPRLREKLSSDAPKVGTPSCRKLGVVIGILLNDGGGYSRRERSTALCDNPKTPITSEATSRARRRDRTYSIMKTLLM